MFPITCNAIGDIIAVVQLIRGIIVAFDDVRGAAEEYRQFVHVLAALGTVMTEIYDLANGSRNESLRQIVLEEVQLCCIDINNAHQSISGFEKLKGSSTRSSRKTTRGLVKKLHWHLMRASDAAKYAKRFSEYHQRLNTYIGLLTHQSTSRSLEVQYLHVLRVVQDQYDVVNRIIRNQEGASFRSNQEIKAIALSTVQQASFQSCQQIVDEMLTRPFFSSMSQDRHLTSSVRRGIKTIFDTLAPHTQPHQRQQFLSLVVPFVIAGAAFAVHTNASPRWQNTGLWSVICALILRVLWLQSSMTMHPSFDGENGIFLLDLLGDNVVVPYQMCYSYETFHRFLDLFYLVNQQDARDYVQTRNYELCIVGTSGPITAENWTCCIRPGIRIQMGLVLVHIRRGPIGLRMCPYCGSQYYNNATSSVDTCADCSRVTWQTREVVPLIKFIGLRAGADVLRRRHATDLNFALSRIEVQFTKSLSAAQLRWSGNHHRTFWASCRRIRVVDVYLTDTHSPEDIRWGSQFFVETLLRNEMRLARSDLGFDSLLSYIYFASYKWDGLTRKDCGILMRDIKTFYDSVRHEIWNVKHERTNVRGPLIFEKHHACHEILFIPSLLTKYTFPLISGYYWIWPGSWMHSSQSHLWRG